MTFWHYHWALLRARELDLTTRERFAFAHLGSLATPGGAVPYSIDSMASDVGLDRRDFGRAVRKLWILGALYAAGHPSGGRRATVYRLPDESEARAIVEADRAARGQPGQGAPDRGQPGQGAPVQIGQPGQGAPDRGQPGQGAPVQPGQGAPDESVASPGEEIYEPRLGLPFATGAGRPGLGAQPGQGAPQPGQGAPYYNKQSKIHEAILPPSQARTLAPNDVRRSRWHFKNGSRH